MEFKFKPIPSEFEIKDKIKQENYLVNGNLVKWEGDFSFVWGEARKSQEEPGGARRSQ